MFINPSTLGVVLYTHVELYTWGTRGTRDTPRGGYPGWIPGVDPDTLAALILPPNNIELAGGVPEPRAGAAGTADGRAQVVQAMA